MTGTAAALHRFCLTLDEPARDQATSPRVDTWRWQVRQRMATLRDALVEEGEYSPDGWLAARSVAILRERNVLLRRLGQLGPAVLEDPDVDAVRSDLKRLAADISHHCQRLHDLAYDEVELELGGSE
jgi:hypothetical protein